MFLLAYYRRKASQRLSRVLIAQTESAPRQDSADTYYIMDEGSTLKVSAAVHKLCCAVAREFASEHCTVLCTVATRPSTEVLLHFRNRIAGGTTCPRYSVQFP
jgi:hypothetical protein